MLQRLRMSRLKLAVMIPFVVFIAVLAIGVSIVEFRKFERESTRVSLEINSAIDQSFHASVASEAAMLRVAAEAIASNDSLKAAFRQGDRARLLQMTQLLFSQINQTAQVTHLYFNDAKRVNVLRVHQPDRQGDIINRHTTLQAERRHEPAQGIELGPLGTLTLRVVVPWFDGKTLLGYIETGKEIDNLFVGLRQQFNIRPLVFLPKARLDRQGWESGMVMLGRAAQWDEFDDDVLTVRDGVSPEVIRSLHAGKTNNLQLDKRWYTWLRLTVPDASGQTAATIGLVMDVTASHDEIIQFGLMVAFVALAGSAIVIGLFWLIIDRVERELMQTRVELAQREALFHALFSRARVAMLLIDPQDGAIIDGNDEACGYYGFDHARLRTMGFAQISTLSEDKLAEEMAAAQSGACSQFFGRHRLASGEMRDIEAHCGPIAVGDRALLFSIVLDVTERRRLEEERARANDVIKTLNRRLQQLLAAASEVAIIATDTDGVITLFNRGAERMLGYDEAEIIGKLTPVHFHLAEEIASEAREADDAIGGFHAVVIQAEREGSGRREWTYVRKDGSHLIVSLAVSAVRSEDGTITGYLAVAQDITERKRAEEGLKDSEERFRSLIEGTTDWVWETDDNHCFIWISSSFDNVIGMESASLLGKRRWDLASESHEIDPSRWQAYMEDLAAHRQFRDFRYWLKTGGGHAKWISASGAPRFDEDGRFLGYRGSGSDVTAYAMTSLRLRTMSKVVEQSPVSVVITDTDGAITYVNPHFTTVTGYGSAEVMGQNLRIIASGETPKEVYEGLWSTILAGGSWAGEFRNRRKDGSLYWEQALIFPVTNDEGLLAHFVSIKEDVTARKEVEARLIEQVRLTNHHYESLRALSDIAALPRLDASQYLAEALALGCRHLGLPVGVIGRIEGSIYTVCHHHAPASIGLVDGQVFETANTCCAITLAADSVVAIPHMAQSDHADHVCYQSLGLEAYIGAPITVRNHRYGVISFSAAQPFGRAFDDGDLEFMRLLARWAGTVLERGMAEQEIRDALEQAEQARHRVDLLLASAGEGIFGVDAHGMVVFVNPAALRMLGQSDEARVIGRDCHEVINHRHRGALGCVDAPCALHQTLADGVARRAHVDDTYCRQDGREFPVEFAVTAMTEDGAITGAVVVFHDITERRAAEQALAEAVSRIERQAAELSSINAELEQFAYVASHDLRQPLRMVSSYLSLIERKLGKDLNEDLKKYFGFAVDGARRMDRLILDLLEYSRTGKNAGPLEPVELTAVLGDSLINLEVAISEAEALVTVAAGLPVINGNSAELVRLFQNLIGNAVKYCPPDRKPVVDVGCRSEGGEWVVSINDNGIGMAPADYERAFQIFQRLVAKEQYEGTGIGLAVCKKIVTNHGGRIWIDSVLGQGSCFYVAFPKGRHTKLSADEG